MKLTTDDGELFYELYAALLSFVNQKLEVCPERFSDLLGYLSTPPEARLVIRDALFEHRQLIDEFIAENPARRKTDELEIVGTWKHSLSGKFYVFRYLKRYTVFLTSGRSPTKAYGVLGLADPTEKLFGPDLPRLISTVLLPFQGKIIFDGLVTSYNITFGGGVKRTLNEEYKQAKEAFGIITSLEDDVALAANPPKKSKQRPRGATKRVSGRPASSEAKEIAEAVTQLTDLFCQKLLNEEYAELCRKLAFALARKRPSPLFQGSLKAWAAGIVRTIGWVNFLNDPGGTPHMKLYSIDEAFGVSESTGAAKLKAIRTMFKIRQFDPKWTLPSKMDDNPLVWMLEVDGFVIDIRDEPRQFQELAFQKGLIPYIPADRAKSGEET